ncbi:MAG: winged helix-turn-helix domain-containing protein, partial [Verrucomicrobiales bacterium]|nr:winged helix-turn-helix domain-containing protein [Verrucomicrobiales bacterium]
KTIRTTSSIPIIFLTARSSEIDRIVGLEIGGDDYVVKPFSPRELAARAKAILRRCSPKAESEDSPSSNETLAIDHDRARITFHGTLLDLSSTEYKLLTTLCAHPGRVFSRAQLMDHAWEDPASALERTVDAHIKTIRSKLKATHPDANDPITTHRGLGYSMAES